MRAFVWPAAAVAVFAATAILEGNGYFDRLENGLAEWRAKLLAHEVDSDIVVIGIDARSLRALSEWPWPRRHHARLLQQLERAEPAAVFLDIDFSSYSTSEDDALFERELADWKGSPVLLASHFQHAGAGDGERILTSPLERFARHTEQVLVNLQPDDDGLVRRARSSWQVEGRRLRSAFAHGVPLADGAEVPIDFAILPSSFEYVSFSDVLNGRIPPATFDGRRVYVGAVAPELGDSISVPVYRSLPGVVLQALSTESVRAGLIWRPPPWLVLTVLGAFATGCACAFGALGWRRNLLGLAGGLLVLGALSVALHALARVDWPVVPFAVAASLMFVAATVRSLDYQTLRAIAYAVGLARKDALLRSVVDCSIDSIICIDGHGLVKTANPSAAELFDEPEARLTDRSVDTLLPSLRAGHEASLESLAGQVVERTGRRRDGTEFPVEVAISRVGLEDDELFTAIVRDISERKEQEAKLEYQATHDGLTGLPNRVALARMLEELLENEDGETRVGLLMLDLCRFKDVNDTLGHDIGDEVLGEVAARFRAELDPNVTICRLGGDEFTVVVTRFPGRHYVDEIVDALVESLRTPITVRGIAIEVGVSIGAALAPEHARDGKQLLQRADIAMYLAKSRGTVVEYYDPAHDSHTVRRLAMVSELRAAIEEDALSLHYQPQVDFRTGRMQSAEALLRWEHPTLGRVSPGEFIPLAETTDLIRPLTDWCVSRALRDMLTWTHHGLELRVAVNVSARVLQDEDFPARLGKMLANHAIAAKQLEIEITETAAMVDPERALRVVGALKNLGVSIAIDDYGTGFSSLGYLRDLDADLLKLDSSFVIDLEQREDNRVIVESTARMAQALGLEIVAEGIETEWVAGFLERAGYDIGQGYYFARPMPGRECFGFVESFNRAPRRAAG